MKKLLRSFLINALAIFLTSRVIEGLSFSDDFRVLGLAALGLGLINLMIKPLVKLVALPITFITLGLFSWVINVLMLYLTTLIIPGFEIKSFYFPGFDYQGFVLPALWITEFWTCVLAAVGISTIGRIGGWLLD